MADRFERGFEAIGWILTAALAAAALWLPEAAQQARQGLLLALAAAMAALNVIGHRLVPGVSDGPLPYRREDKALIVSLGMVMLLTTFLYALPGGPPELNYLFLLPMIASTMMLHEKVVFGEALLSALAMVFLRLADRAVTPFWTVEFAVRLAVFAAGSGCLVALTAWLRGAYADADRMTEELSRRLEQIRVIGSLARQSELTPHLDDLASRVGAIVAEAAGTERHAVFVRDETRGEDLRQVGGAAFRSDAVRGVLETGVARIFDAASGEIGGDARIRNMLALPLRVRHGSIGVMCLLNRRGDGTFLPEDVQYCELLAGFTASLLNGALLFQRAVEERKTVEQLAKLMVGREAKMRELKDRLEASSRL